MLKITYSEMQKRFEKKGFKLLSKEYTGCKQNMKYLCHCGNTSYTQLANLSKINGCSICAGNIKHNIEDIKKYFKDNNCELLSTKYNNTQTPLLYKCSCGNISTITYSHFKNGIRCRKCYGKRNRGKNHYRWNGELTVRNRCVSPKYINWKKSVLERDNYVCKKCGCDLKKYYTGVHHILGWADNIESRYDVDNGISFCDHCHRAFHLIYGQTNTTKQQLKEYLDE